MEYDNFLTHVAPDMSPVPPQEFLDWLALNPTMLQDYADMLMYTLPLPRWKWYQPSDF